MQLKATCRRARTAKENRAAVITDRARIISLAIGKMDLRNLHAVYPAIDPPNDIPYPYVFSDVYGIAVRTAKTSLGAAASRSIFFTVRSRDRAMMDLTDRSSLFVPGRYRPEFQL